MPRKTDRKPTVDSPIRSKQEQLAAMEAQVKAKLDKTKAFLDKVPALKDEVQKKQQREIVDRFNRPVRIDGPADYRLNFDRHRTFGKPAKLRKDRSLAPLLTVVLLVAFCVVAYFAWTSLAQD